MQFLLQAAEIRIEKTFHSNDYNKKEKRTI